MTAFRCISLFPVLGALLSFAATAGDVAQAQSLSSPAERRQAMIERIDELLRSKCEQQGVTLAPTADDGEFLRRVYLDLTGVIPRVAAARRFLNDDSSNKREQLIDQLLDSPSYPSHLAEVWRKVMLPRGFDAQQAANAIGLEQWFREQFVNNLRYDRLVSEFLVAQGSGQTGPTLFYTSLELQPERLAASTSRIFLGLQIECAQCHDHPFDHWKQIDFWGYAAFFARLRQSNQRARQTELTDTEQGEVMLPDTEQVVAPKYPGGRAADASEGGTRRAQLSIWMASRDNPFLARAAVNRVWARMFGRGLVEPLDDMGPQNPPSHPELLDELAAYFVRTGFDLQELHRTLANTRAYQRSSRNVNDPPAVPELFAAMAVKTLTPEQLYDSLTRVLAPRPLTAPPGVNGASRSFDARRQAFIAKMQSPTSSSSQFDAGIVQALTLLNGSDIAEATDPRRSGVLQSLQAPFFTSSDRVEILWLATYSRFPSDQERQLLEEVITNADDEPQALGNLLWAVLNSAEFTFNH